MRSADESALADGRATFERLIRPIATERFFSDHWEKRPLHIPGAHSEAFEPLLSLRDIEKILCALDRNPVQFTVVNADKEIKRSDYLVNKRDVDVIRLLQLVGEGSTLVLNHMHLWREPLGEFCSALERFFSMPVQCNVYLSAPGGQGFKPHFDTHDVFILQAAGRKTWRTYHPTIEFPMRGQAFRLDHDMMGEPAGSFDLAAGDVAYIPRGWGHEGRASDDWSLHLTVGVLSYTWAELLIEAVSAACACDPQTRRALPVGFARSGFDADEARSLFTGHWRRLEQAIDFDSALAHFVNRFIDSAPLDLDGQLRELSTVKALSLDSIVGARAGAVYSLHSTDDKVSIRRRGRSVEFPAAALPAIEFALKTPRFRVREAPDALDEEGKLVLVRRLILEGLLIRKDSG